MPPARNGRDLRAYRRKAAKLRRNSTTCWICGDAIDITLDHKDPMSWTADHLDPLANGGHALGEIKPAHRRCNSSRGARPQPPQPRTSREW